MWFVQVLIAFLAGAGGSIIAPWSNWGVEKKRDRTKRRERLVSSWYQMVRDCQSNNDLEIIEHKHYLTLRNHLSKEIIRKLEYSGTHITIRANAGGISANEDLEIVLNEVKRLQEKWGLL